LTREGQLLVNYFKFRSDVLKKVAEPNLMDRQHAKIEFDKLSKVGKWTIATPYNKQKGEKRHPAYLTGILNILSEKTLKKLNFDPSPRKLVVTTRNKKPLRVLSRWVDGAYPSTTNPIAVWELKNITVQQPLEVE
jgi:hypothetical protein